MAKHSASSPRSHSPTTIEIPLTQGKVAIIDRDDADLVSGYSWRASFNNGAWYAVTTLPPENRRRRTLGMHRLIMGDPDGLLIDHEDGDGLNNRRSNLRECTHSQNRQNIHKTNRGAVPFIGVRLSHKGKFLAEISLGGKKQHIGTYDTAEEAARVRDQKARELYGEFATLNFPDDREVAA